MCEKLGVRKIGRQLYTHLPTQRDWPVKVTERLKRTRERERTDFTVMHFETNAPCGNARYHRPINGSQEPAAPGRVFCQLDEGSLYSGKRAKQCGLPLLTTSYMNYLFKGLWFTGALPDHMLQELQGCTTSVCPCTYRGSCGETGRGEKTNLIATCAKQLFAICLAPCGPQKISFGSDYSAEKSLDRVPVYTSPSHRRHVVGFEVSRVRESSGCFLCHIVPRVSWRPYQADMP